MINIVNLSKTYDGGHLALDDVSIDIDTGDIFGIIGLSGAGKSTLIRCINSLEMPSKGKVLVDGKDITSLSKKDLISFRKNTAMLFQNFNLFSSKTVLENVIFPIKLSKTPHKDAVNKATKLLEKVGIQSKTNSYPSQLSGGQKQRVAIARALIQEPKILLLDEATSALDSETAEKILELIRDVKEELGLTVVLITHDMDVVKKICNKAVVLDNGKISQSGDVLSIFMSDRYRKSYDVTDLPKGVQKGCCLSLIFHKDTATKPIISVLSRDLGVDVNILLGNIEYVGNDTLGELLIEVNDKDVEKAVKFLRSNNIIVEVKNVPYN